MDLDDVDQEVVRNISSVSLVKWFQKAAQGEDLKDPSIFRANYRGFMTAWFVLSAVILTTGKLRVGLWAAIPTGILSKQINYYYLHKKELPEDSYAWNEERVEKSTKEL